jgi:hypothetical protein
MVNWSEETFWKGEHPTRLGGWAPLVLGLRAARILEYCTSRHADAAEARIDLIYHEEARGLTTDHDVRLLGGRLAHLAVLAARVVNTVWSILSLQSLLDDATTGN